MYRVGARECGFAIRLLVHVLVRESVGRVQKDLTCASTCHWCVNVKCSGAVTEWRGTAKRAIIQVEVLIVRALFPLVRESELVLLRTKRDWEVRGATQKGYYVCLKN